MIIGVLCRRGKPIRETLEKATPSKYVKGVNLSSKKPYGTSLWRHGGSRFDDSRSHTLSTRKPEFWRTYIERSREQRTAWREVAQSRVPSRHFHSSTLANQSQSLPDPPLPDLLKLRQCMVLPTSQNLFYDEYGRADGLPIIWLHGWPSCGAEGAALHGICARLGVRLISPDRPGMGRSSPWRTGEEILSSSDPNPSFYPILEYASHLAALAYHLNLGQFAVLGGSGGGPYATSAANSLQQRIDDYSKEDLISLIHANTVHETDTNENFQQQSEKENKALSSRSARKPELAACGVFAGIGPYSIVGTSGQSLLGRIAGNLVARSPILGRATMRYFQRAAAAPDGKEKIAAKTRSQVKWMPAGIEREILSRESTIQLISHIFHCSFRQELGAWTEARANLTDGKDWGFELQNIRWLAKDGHGVRFWYGSRDTNTPLSHGEAMARRIPGSVLRSLDGHTHFTVQDDLLSEIIVDLIRAMGEDPLKWNMPYKQLDNDSDYVLGVLDQLTLREKQLDESELGSIGEKN